MPLSDKVYGGIKEKLQQARESLGKTRAQDKTHAYMIDMLTDEEIDRTVTKLRKKKDLYEEKANLHFSALHTTDDSEAKASYKSTLAYVSTIISNLDAPTTNEVDNNTHYFVDDDEIDPYAKDFFKVFKAICQSIAIANDKTLWAFYQKPKKYKKSNLMFTLAEDNAGGKELHIVLSGDGILKQGENDLLIQVIMKLASVYVRRRNNHEIAVKFYSQPSFATYHALLYRMQIELYIKTVESSNEHSLLKKEWASIWRNLADFTILSTTQPQTRRFNNAEEFTSAFIKSLDIKIKITANEIFELRASIVRKELLNTLDEQSKIELDFILIAKTILSNHPNSLHSLQPVTIIDFHKMLQKQTNKVPLSGSELLKKAMNPNGFVNKACSEKVSVLNIANRILQTGLSYTRVGSNHYHLDNEGEGLNQVKIVVDDELTLCKRGSCPQCQGNKTIELALIHALNDQAKYPNLKARPDIFIDEFSEVTSTFMGSSEAVYPDTMTQACSTERSPTDKAASLYSDTDDESSLDLHDFPYPAYTPVTEQNATDDIPVSNDALERLSSIEPTEEEYLHLRFDKAYEVFTKSSEAFKLRIIEYKDFAAFKFACKYSASLVAIYWEFADEELKNQILEKLTFQDARLLLCRKNNEEYQSVLTHCSKKGILKTILLEGYNDATPDKGINSDYPLFIHAACNGLWHIIDLYFEHCNDEEMEAVLKYNNYKAFQMMCYGFGITSVGNASASDASECLNYLKKHLNEWKHKYALDLEVMLSRKDFKPFVRAFTVNYSIDIAKLIWQYCPTNLRDKMLLVKSALILRKILLYVQPIPSADYRRFDKRVTLEYFWSICPPSIKQALLEGLQPDEEMSLFGKVCEEGCDVSVSFMLEKCELSRRQHLVERADFAAFNLAARGGCKAILLLLLEACLPERRQAMLEACDDKAFKNAVKHKHLDVIALILRHYNPLLVAELTRKDSFAVCKMTYDENNLELLRVLYTLLSPKARRECIWTLEEHSQASYSNHPDIEMLAFLESIQEQLTPRNTTPIKNISGEMHFGETAKRVLTRFVEAEPGSLESSHILTLLNGSQGHLLLEFAFSRPFDDVIDILFERHMTTLNQDAIHAGLVTSAKKGFIDVIDRIRTTFGEATFRELIEKNEHEAFRAALIEGRADVVANLIESQLVSIPELFDMLKKDNCSLFLKSCEGEHLGIIERVLEYAEYLQDNTLQVLKESIGAKGLQKLCGLKSIDYTLIKKLFNDKNEIKELLKSSHYQPIITAIAYGKLELATHLLAHFDKSSWQEIFEAQSFWAFNLACRNGDEKAVRFLLQHCKPSRRQAMLKSQHFQTSFAATEGPDEYFNPDFHTNDAPESISAQSSRQKNLVSISSISNKQLADVQAASAKINSQSFFRRTYIPDNLFEVAYNSLFPGFTLAAVWGHCRIMLLMLLEVDSDERSTMLTAKDFAAFRQAAKHGRDDVCALIYAHVDASYLPVLRKIAVSNNIGLEYMQNLRAAHTQYCEEIRPTETAGSDFFETAYGLFSSVKRNVRSVVNSLETSWENLAL